jgi:hypothetical protein
VRLGVADVVTIALIKDNWLSAPTALGAWEQLTRAEIYQRFQIGWLVLAALPCEPEGREFESLRAHHIFRQFPVAPPMRGLHPKPQHKFFHPG